MKTKLSIVTPVLLALALAACAKTTPASSPAKAEAKPAAVNTQAPAVSAKDDKAMEPAGTTVGNVTVVEAVACRSVEDRSPVGTAETFPTDVGRVFLFTNVKLTTGTEGAIQHVWYFSGKEVAKVTLPVQGDRWRTYSSKAVDAMTKGDWRVDVTTADNQLIKSVTFKVQ